MIVADSPTAPGRPCFANRAPRRPGTAVALRYGPIPTTTAAMMHMLAALDGDLAGNNGVNVRANHVPAFMYEEILGPEF